jgi:hypothetical protein
MTIDSVSTSLNGGIHHSLPGNSLKRILVIAKTSSHHGNSPLSQFLEASISDEEKRRLLIEASPTVEFRLIAKKLFVVDCHYLINILEMVDIENQARDLIGWILLRVPCTWPEVILSYLDECDNEDQKGERFRYFFSLLSSAAKMQMFKYFFDQRSHSLFYEYFFHLKDLSYQNLLMDSLTDINTSHLFDDMMIYMWSLKNGTFKAQVEDNIKRLLLSGRSYSNALQIQGSVSPIGYLFAKKYLLGDSHLVNHLELNMNLDHWCSELINLLNGEFSECLREGILFEVMDSLSFETCGQLMISASEKKPQLLSDLLVCCPMKTMMTFSENYCFFFMEMTKVASSYCGRLYESISHNYPPQVDLLKQMYPINNLQKLPPFLVGVYMLHEKTRRCILDNIAILNVDQIRSLASAWPNDHFLNELYSVERRLSIEQMTIILKNCSQDNLEEYLNCVGRIYHEKFEESVNDYFEYIDEYNEKYFFLNTDLKVLQYLSRRYFRVTKEIRMYLHWKVVPLLLERASVLYEKDYDLLSRKDYFYIHKVYLEAQKLLQQIPKPKVTNISTSL